MSHWVYILSCEDHKLYVGETRRLYDRIGEHGDEFKYSCIQCELYPPKYMYGMYDPIKNEMYEEYSNILCNDDEEYNNGFLEGDLAGVLFNYSKWEQGYNYYGLKHDAKKIALDLEKDLTLTLMKKLGGNWDNVRGGPYCKEYINKNPSVTFNYTRPCCKCPHKMPAELHEYKGVLYFRCVKIGMKWYDGPILIPYQDDQCDFYLPVNRDNNYCKNNFKKYYVGPTRT